MCAEPGLWQRPHTSRDKSGLPGGSCRTSTGIRAAPALTHGTTQVLVECCSAAVAVAAVERSQANNSHHRLFCFVLFFFSVSFVFSPLSKSELCDTLLQAAAPAHSRAPHVSKGFNRINIAKTASHQTKLLQLAG